MQEFPGSDKFGGKVPVVDPYGRFGTIDPSEANHALSSGGFKLASNDQISEYFNKQEFGDGAENSLKALAASAARAVTLGGSDVVLTGTGLVEPNTFKQLSKYHPLADLTGGGLGIAGSIALTPEALALKGASTALKAAEATGDAAQIAKATEAFNAAKTASETLKASDFLVPTYGVSKVGSAISEAALPAAGGIAGLVASPETRPVINKILSGAISQGAGSAVEGAAYGAGNAVSEAALGDDPHLNAEKLLAHMGYGALLGGAIGGGVGGLFGGLGKIGKTEASSLPQRAELAAKYGAPEATDAGALTQAELPKNPTLPQALELSGVPKETQEVAVKGISKLKANADDIRAAGLTLDAPVLEGMISADEQVQRLESSLTQSPSLVGIRRQEQYAEGIQKATGAAENALGQGSEMSLAEVGDSLKQSISKRFESDVEPISALYKDIKEQFEKVPLNKNTLKDAADDIRKIEGTDVSHQAKSMAEDFAKRLESFEDVDQLKRFKSAIRDELPGGASSKIQKRIAYETSKVLGKLEEKSILNFAESAMKSPEEQQRIAGLVKQRAAANKAYKELSDKMGTMGDVIGKRKISGPEDFIDYISEITPEKFAKNLFNKNNAQFLQWFQKEFPQETSLLSQYQRSEIVKAATKSGQFKPQEVFKALQKMPKEMKEILFTPEELTKLKAAKTYLDSIPKDINPSHTSMAEGYRDLYKKPVAFVLDNGLDYVNLKRIQSAVGDTSGAAASSNKIAKLGTLERTLQKTDQTIQTRAKRIFDFSQEATPRLASYFGSSGSQSDKSKNTKDNLSALNERANNPEKLIDDLHNSTEHLYSVAPDMTSGIHQTAVRATQFLASKVPQTPTQKVLAKDYVLSPADLAKFNRYQDVVENPVKVLEHVKNSTLTPEALEALQTVYPKLYDQMKASVLEHLTNHISKKNVQIPYRTKMALSMFLGQDLDNSFDSQSIQSNQMALASPGQAQAQSQMNSQMKVSQKGLSTLSRSQQMLTSMQATSQRNDG